MPDSDIYGTLNQIFADVFFDDTIRVEPETTAKDITGWDSFKQIEIILAIEERYGIKLNAREVDDLHNVGDLAAVIEKHTARN